MPRKYPRAQGYVEDNSNVRRITITLPELDFKLIVIYADAKCISFSAYIAEIVNQHIREKAML